jgi:hypothetical protein
MRAKGALPGKRAAFGGAQRIRVTHDALPGHYLGMRRSSAIALLALTTLATGCGRSGLDDDLAITPDGVDGGGPADAGQLVDGFVSPPVEDVTVPPTDDATSDSTFPPPPPPFDGTIPLIEDDSSTDDVFVPVGGCGFATCTGCCDANGGCHEGHDTSACGGQGEQCKSCDQLCVDGICLNLSSNCGPSNCTGCCLGTDVCTDGLHAGACGSGGMQCESCNPATGGGKCVANTTAGGACVFPTSATCGTSVCPMGCCVGDLCVQGTQDIACGSGGVGCQDCTQNGRTCLGRTCSF